MRNFVLSYHRRPTSTTHVGNLQIGSAFPVRVQSMANTDTNDVSASAAQYSRIVAAGAELVRFTTQGTREVESLSKIRKSILESEVPYVPIVADVHFNANVADEAAKIVEKVRINPGNYVDPARQFKQLVYTNEEYAAELSRLENRFVQLIDICKNHSTALRIGVNHGSLSDRIMSRYGDTPAGMVESCMEFLRVCAKNNFQNVVISIKASTTFIMVETVRLLVSQMDKENLHFPLHLGVTEAGEGEDGRIKSAVGIGALLADGIGDTIRVSLSEAPEAELPVAEELVRWFDCTDSDRYSKVEIYEENDKLYYLSSENTDYTNFALHCAADLGKPLFESRCKTLIIRNHNFPQHQLNKLAMDVLQAAGLIRYKTEYVSCPSCGRTLFDIETTILQIKKATSHLKGLKIGIMGCIVNGPGEMADADYGYVGAGRGKISLYKGKQCIMKNIPQEEAVNSLIELIKQNGDWQEP